MTVSLLDRHFLKRESAAATTVVVASLVVNLGLLAMTGVHIGGDTVRYVEGAGNLLSGRPLEGMQALFPGYIALVAASAKLGAGTLGVVVVQIAVAALATLALFRIGRRLSNVACGTIAALLFALNVDLARWHLFVLTDSLYISLVIIATYAAHEAAERGGWRYVAASVLVLVAATLRPHGRVLIVSAALYWIARRPTLRRDAVVAYAAAAILLIALAVTTGATLRAEAETPGRWLGNGVVIWSDTASQLSMPHDAVVDPAAAGATSTAPLRYAARHPIATLRLAVTRVSVELWHARRFYSRAHNAAVVALLGVTYACAVVGFLRRRHQPIAWLMAIVVASHLAFVAATFADWDGRFVLYVLPLIDVFAGAAIA
ncbi:MAG TPA: glycosyltransferase family 39 protein [Vicinamibacterales bacterium]|nr:glycosyltransferase family 39 protein [Vicinamibacterales bacterium]